MLRVVALAAGLVVGVGSAAAAPDPSPDPSPGEPPPPSAAPLPPQPVYVPVYGPLSTATRRYEYGWKIAASDGVALGLVLAAVAISEPGGNEDSLALTGSDALVLLGVAWWSTVTPLMHLTERNGYGAALSFGLRYGLPLAGALVGHSFDGPDSSNDNGALVGICVGALAASAIDITLLAHRTERGGAVWMPTFSASSNTYRIGLGRSF